MNNCPDCTTAETNPRTCHFQSLCLECSARSLAGSPAFFDSARANAMTATYKSALRYVGGDGWMELHERVKHYAERIAIADRANSTPGETP